MTLTDARIQLDRYRDMKRMLEACRPSTDVDLIAKNILRFKPRIAQIARDYPKLADEVGLLL
jgi:hypothetical protein